MVQEYSYGCDLEKHMRYLRGMLQMHITSYVCGKNCVHDCILRGWNSVEKSEITLNKSESSLTSPNTFSGHVLQ